MATSHTSGAAAPAQAQAQAHNRRTGAPVVSSSSLSSSLSSSVVEKSDTSPAVPAAVIYKLLAFTFAMVTFPISTYFLTLNTVFGGNSTYSGASAAVMANVVLFGYVFAAMKEDQSDRLDEKREADARMKMLASKKAE